MPLKGWIFSQCQKDFKMLNLPPGILTKVFHVSSPQAVVKIWFLSDLSAIAPLFANAAQQRKDRNHFFPHEHCFSYSSSDTLVTETVS